MSLELDLADPWVRLQLAYENCTAKQYVSGHYGKYEDGKLSMCGIGWALHAAGWSDEELVGMNGPINCQIKSIMGSKDATRALQEYGFPEKERRKSRNCPMPDCTYRVGLQGILEHLNECHQIPIPNIGKLLPVIRNDTKPRPTIADWFKIIKEDVKGLFKS